MFEITAQLSPPAIYTARTPANTSLPPPSSAAQCENVGAQSSSTECTETPSGVPRKRAAQHSQDRHTAATR
eukprot:CAMPEP_0177673882 /NCGR_PEP_ID=MMETSP0447-20121125/26220_1 /TAXON_ID=0 /ORGANISM="Stygamoeba regulata, Strain BSH-02190019" /LENGTH=70 /DNA_ID=CAMNT_0019181863 /DNA_START=63 /DNA_END=272 /DNA_ORIENTATION=-